ncbi:MAG: hypothetical protein ACXQTR_05600 [Candidatus Methanospirareceae archaeon]
MSKYRIHSTEPSKWGLTKKNQLYFIKFHEGIIVKFQKWYDGVALMIFVKDRGYGIKLRTDHIMALIHYLKGNIIKVREIIEHQNDLDYLEELEENDEIILKQEGGKSE